MSEIEKPASTAIIKLTETTPIFKGKIPNKYWNEIAILHQSGVSSRKISLTLNDKYNGEFDFTYSSILSLINFFDNQKTKEVIDSTFLNEVADNIPTLFKKISKLTNFFEEVMEECKVNKDYNTAFKAGDRLSKLYFMQMQAVQEARDNSKGGIIGPSEEQRQDLMKHVMKKLQLSPGTK